MKGRWFKDRTGETIGIYEVLKYVKEIVWLKTGYPEHVFLTKCSKCGYEEERLSRYLSPKHKYCGNKECQARYRSEQLKGNTYGVYHGDSGKRLYRIWSGMKSRCFYVKHHSYKDYGGRGITVCEEWLEYSTFKEWAMTNGYEEHLTIERIGINDNYCPENCEWKTMWEQSRNKRNNVLLNIDGETLCLVDALERYDLSWDVYNNRIGLGFTPIQALTLPRDWWTTDKIEIDGELLSMNQALRKYKVDFKTYKRRLERGYTPQQALRMKYLPNRKPR